MAYLDSVSHGLCAQRYLRDARILLSHAACNLFIFFRSDILLIRLSLMKLVQAWIEIHKEDLMADWKLAVAGEPVFKIDPLR